MTNSSNLIDKGTVDPVLNQYNIDNAKDMTIIVNIIGFNDGFTRR